ncbi:MAG: Lin1244/Lin1753 domain-containing protein [Dehalococcoidia bacterium]|jgi:hypothetical protein
MARPTKEGVDYFSHDVDACNKKTMMILESRFGNDGYAFWFKLLEILGASATLSYRTDSDDDWLVLVTKTRVTEAVAFEILDLLARLGAIDPDLWEHRIIWVQKLVDRIAPVYEKRKALIPQKPELPERKPNKRNENAGYGGDSGAISTQSKVKESKVKESKDICAPDGAPDANPPTKKEIEALFERLWSLYPRKRGKGQVKDAAKRRLAEVGEDHMTRCIDRFKADMKAQGRAMDTYPYGSTFFNSGFVDYLDHEYTPHEVRAGPRKKLDGLQYDQRPPEDSGLDRDFDDLEIKQKGGKED